MILAVKPLDNSELKILYICTEKDEEFMMKEIEALDIGYISSDKGVRAHEGDPFLLSLIYVN